MDLIVSQQLHTLEGSKPKREQSLAKTLVKATLVFVSVSLVAFFGLNSRAIVQQVSDHFQITNAPSDLLTDTDSDGLPDWWEHKYAFAAEQTGDESGDPDAEQLVNLGEYTYDTDPRNPDTDSDGFSDKDEIDHFFDPLLAGAVRLDFDHDGLPDWWEKQYGFIIGNDESNEDPDGDGLINRKEFDAGTNPLVADTDGDGRNDGEEIRNGYNPLGQGALDTDGDGLTDREESVPHTDPTKKDTDGDGLSDFDEVKTYGTNPLVADTDGDGFSDKAEVDSGYDPLKTGGAKLASRDADGDGLSLQDEERLGTNPNKGDSDEDGITDGQELQLGTDPTADKNPTTTPQVEIRIPKISVIAPVVFVAGTTEEDYQKGLESGAIHLPQTPFPGLAGNSYITGHSSDYAFKPGNYKEIFVKLNDLAVDDTVEVALHYYSGRVRVQRWRMFQKQIVAADDQRLFAQTAEPVLTLATCWPINTSWQRVMEKFELQETVFE